MDRSQPLWDIVLIEGLPGGRFAHHARGLVEARAQVPAQALQALYWHEFLLRSSRTREHLLPVPDWRTLETMKLISPGVCLEFQPATAFEKPLCGQSEGLGKAPPRWFAAIVPTFLGSHAEVVRPVSPRAASAGTVVATPDEAAAISLAWEYVLNVIDVALLMAAAIALLASLAIAHALAPARAIVAALFTSTKITPSPC